MADKDVAIETVKEGDLVWAENPETKERSLKRVVRTFRNQSNELVQIRTSDEEITATPTHPFYVRGKGWVRAGDLQKGDKLCLRDGTCTLVVLTHRKKLKTTVNVYNFEVEDFHTYYVGIQGILVHNMCQPQNKTPNGAKRKGAFRAAKREIGVPRSQQPKVMTNINKRDEIIPGRVYDFGKGKFIRDDVVGHIFKDGGKIPRHFNTPSKSHYFY